MLREDLWQAAKEPSMPHFDKLKPLNIQNRRYLGNKYRLLNFIDGTIAQECGHISSMADLFAGTGVVAYHFMNRLKVTVNDSLYSNFLSHVAFMSDENVDMKKISDLVHFYNAKNSSSLDENYVSATFSETFFSLEDCKKIGFIREDIDERKKEGNLNIREEAILITSLLYSMDRIANTCGHYDAYRKQEPIAKLKILPLDLNKKPASHNIFFNEDTNKLALSGRMPFSDLVYLDPPYNSRNYCDLYHVLENIARWEKPKVTGKARKMDRSSLKSQYCSKDAPLALSELVGALKCRYIVLSYNNTGSSANMRSNAKISDSEITDILSSKGEVKVYDKAYRPFCAGKSKTSSNRERLFICEVKNET